MILNKSVKRRMMRLRVESVAILVGIFLAIALPATYGTHALWGLSGLWHTAISAFYAVIAAVLAQRFAHAHWCDGLNKLDRELRESTKDTIKRAS